MADRPTLSASDGAVARYLVQPVTRFLQIEAAGGVLLLAATVVALVWANSPWSAAYHQLWSTTVSIEAGSLHLSEDLGHWVNDGLMAVFFFVVGLEIKRELVTGQLRGREAATLPAIAALGGMVVPAAIFVALNAGGVGLDGWGIPMATDIAFAVGVLAVLGSRVPDSLKVLLLGLAIADDIGAIIVIAAFYSDGIELRWLLPAVGGLLVVALMRRVGIQQVSAYVVVGAGVWACTLESGVHATIAGVALGLLAPARPLASRDGEPEPVSVVERLETSLHPWTSYVVVPVFALANAGISLDGDALRSAASSRVTLGVVVGLVAGKLAGISAFAWLAVRFGLARLPDGVRWRQILGMASIAGIGFTVSIFIAGLAYPEGALQTDAKIGVLLASTLAAGIGSVILVRSGPPDRPRRKNLAAEV